MYVINCPIVFLNFLVGHVHVLVFVFNTTTLPLLFQFTQGPNTPALPSQIELTLITAQSSSAVQAYVEQIANHLDLRHLRKISALCVSDPTSMVLQSGGMDDDSGTSGAGHIELSQQFGSASPSELSKCCNDCDHATEPLGNGHYQWL